VIASARAAIVLSVSVAISLFVGYLIAGASLGDIVTGPSRYNALSIMVLPVLAGVVGVLLAGVANAVFGTLAERLAGLRNGAPATTPGMTALVAGAAVGALPAARAPTALAAPSRSRLTQAERAVVAHLADGLRPKQIALLRSVALSTIRSQIKAAKRKTGARTIEQLIADAWYVDE
jgi:DNA-binding CsgD family transcriptional regulator